MSHFETLFEFDVVDYGLEEFHPWIIDFKLDHRRKDFLPSLRIIDRTPGARKWCARFEGRFLFSVSDLKFDHVTVSGANILGGIGNGFVVSQSVQTTNQYVWGSMAAGFVKRLIGKSRKLINE